MVSRHEMTTDASCSDAPTALAALDADQLRLVVLDLLATLDDKSRILVERTLEHHAAHKGAGWSPTPVSEGEVANILASLKAAMRSGHGNPVEIDRYLRLGTSAFLGKDYRTAQQIFGAVLRPIADAEIDLGQDELVDEVLTSDVNLCAAQYLVSTYMVTAPEQRAQAVLAAIGEVNSVAYFWEPLRQLEGTAIEPLPAFDTFLPQWRSLVAQRALSERSSEWDRHEDRWLREVVLRLAGPAGLADIGRSTRRADDLRAWCRSLFDAKEWAGARLAYEEAAALVAEVHAKADFLDGAALAAQQSASTDLIECFEGAWRAKPTLLRLRRWLGMAGRQAEVVQLATAALAAAPQPAHGQCAFLHLLLGDFESAATLLATAPGLGWSDDAHPGHLLFQLFEALIAPSRAAGGQAGVRTAAQRALELDDLVIGPAGPEGPKVIAPAVGELLERAGIVRIADSATLAMVLAAMRQAAERRLAGVTAQKRRRHYGHAAELVATCLACDRSPEAMGWIAAIQQDYRRFPALRAELDAAMTVR